MGLVIIIIIIALIIVFSKKSSKNSGSNYKKVLKKSLKLSEYYNHPTVKRHYEILEKINPLYSKVHKSGDYHSKDAYKFESLCLEDISHAEEFAELCKKYNQPVKSYPAFKQLAIFYEKQGNPQLAIPLCEESIRVGFYDDGTKDGMEGRLKRLEKKYNNGGKQS